MTAVPNPSNEEIGDILKRVRTIAVVGASTNPQKEAHTVPAFMKSQGYRIIPINPNADEIFGEKAYPSLTDLPEDLVKEVDMVNLFRPGEQVGPHVEAAIELDIPIVWMQQGIRNDEWAGKAKAAGLTVVQDLCIRMAYQYFKAKWELS